MGGSINRLAPLETRLSGLSPAKEPDAWAMAAYRLGLALIEDVSQDRDAATQRATQLFERSAKLLSAERAPVEHARVLIAAGAAWRSRGSAERALPLFRRAAELMEGRASPTESGAAWSNLGLAESEAGNYVAAGETFAIALKALRPENLNDGERCRAYGAAALNMAQNVLDRGDSAQPTSDDFAAHDQAASVVNDALQFVRIEDGALYVGMLNHVLGLIHMHTDHLAEAASAFERSLNALTRTTFPFQHAVATFNRGRAYERLGDVRRALVCFEDAAQTFDPRLHRGQWSSAATRLAELDRVLADVKPGAVRADHVADLLVSCEPAERTRILRERIVRLTSVPAEAQQLALGAIAASGLRLRAPGDDVLLRAVLDVLLEVPDVLMRSGLLAQIDAHAGLEPDARIDADRRLDVAIQECGMGPQRVRMRDVLYATGWERPEPAM